MKKIKLLLAAAVLLFSAGAWAQTDVTGTYITNPGFEDEYAIETTYSAGTSNERHIYKPNGWTVVQTNANNNDLTCLKSGDAQSSSFSSYTMNHSGNQTYWVRLRWGGQVWKSSGTEGSPTAVELQQVITLPNGVYRLSADLLHYAGGTEANNHTYLTAQSSNNVWTVEPTKYHSKADTNWENKSMLITSSGNTEYTIILKALQNWNQGNENIFAFDDVKLEKYSVDADNTLEITSIVPTGTGSWTNNGANNAGTFSNNGVDMVERYYNNHYTGTVSELVIKDLPTGAYDAEVYCQAHCADWNCSAIAEAAGQTDRTILSANNVEVGIPIVNDKSLTEGPQVRTLTGIEVTNGTLTFKVRNDQEGANWLTFEIKSLTYKGASTAFAEAAWTTAHSTLEALDATALPDAVETAITAELAKSMPNTVDDINAATAALQAFIDSYDGIKAAFDEYKALKAAVEDLKNTSKYTFTGADALSTFNTTLSTIDEDAEAATDAATLTALLPSLKTAGNNFVGAIESLDGFDLTYNIENNSFETGALSPWTTNGSNDTGVKPNSNGTYTTTGVDGDYLFNTWNNGAGSKVSQTLSSLPEGYYTVTALVASDAGNSIKIIAGASEKEIEADETDGKNKFVEGTTDKTLANGSLEIGTNSSKWYKCDNFRLTYYTVTAGARDAWLAAKATAEAAYANGNYANVTGAEKTALKAEIDKAEPSTAADYGEATTALQTATSTFIDAKPSYDALVVVRTTAGETYTTANWPRAAASKKTALDDAVAAAPTDAADAVTKANAIITVYRQFVESNGLAEGVDVAVNFTNTYLAGADPDTNTGWTNGIGTDNRANEQYTKGDGTQGGRYYDGGWSTSAAVNINMTRELTLPAGQYQLQITARGSTSLTSYTMSIGGETVNLPVEGADANKGTFGHGWSDKFVVFNSDGTTPLTLAITATSTEYQQWISFNRLRLVKLDATLATSEDYAALNTAITTAEGNLGFETGKNAPYANTDAMELLLAAKAIDQTANNVQGDVQAATTALTGATWTANTEDVDAIYNGNFAEANGTNPKGWTRSNNGWGQQITDLTAEANGVATGTTTAWYYNTNGAWQYGNDGVYTMPLAANQAYVLSFKYRKHNSDWQNWMKASVINSNNEGLEVAEFAAAEDGTNFVTAKAYFTTGAAGNYILSIEQNGNAHLTDVSLVKATPDELILSENSAYVPTDRTYYETLNITRTIKAGYNTVVLPFDLTSGQVQNVFGTGSEVYSYSEESADANSVTINFTKGDGSITANVPVLVKATVASTEQVFNGVQIVAAAEAKVEGTYLDYVGVYETTELAAGDFFIATKGGVQNVYQSQGLDGKKDTVKGFRAYFKNKNTSTNVKAFMYIGDDDATGILTIDNEQLTIDNEIYNLAGQRMSKMQKGINIVNGKKVLF